MVKTMTTPAVPSGPRMGPARLPRSFVGLSVGSTMRTARGALSPPGAPLGAATGTEPRGPGRMGISAASPGLPLGGAWSSQQQQQQ